MIQFKDMGCVESERFIKEMVKGFAQNNGCMSDEPVVVEQYMLSNQSDVDVAIQKWKDSRLSGAIAWVLDHGCMRYLAIGRERLNVMRNIMGFYVNVQDDDIVVYQEVIID